VLILLHVGSGCGELKGMENVHDDCSSGKDRRAR
jgi:hypothetical protein